MKHLLIVAVLLSAVIFGVWSVPTAYAESPIGAACNGAAANASICKAGNQDPITGENGLIMKITAILAYVIGFVAVLMIVLAGMKFVTSNGNPEAVAGARNTIIYALVGLVIAASSQLIVKFILSLI